MIGLLRARRDAPDDFAIPGNTTWAIFLISALGLFLEMLLIRWIGTEIRIFAYLQNTVLVVCFLGLGIGMFTSRQPILLRQMLMPLALLVFLMAFPYSRRLLGNISEWLSVMEDMVIWYNWIETSPARTLLSVAKGLSLTFVVMAILLDIFVPIGRLLGRLMDQHPQTIWAYSVNVAGSLIGTWLFVLLSAYYQPPLIWFVFLVVMLAAFLKRSAPTWRVNALIMAGLVALSLLAGLDRHALETIWSPYQKLTLRVGERLPSKLDRYVIHVNNVGYQAMIDLGGPIPAYTVEQARQGQASVSQYDIPFMLHPAPRSCLLVGAGSGNDAAGALRAGVAQVVAVEIDPAIIKMGSARHPERPYADPRVQVVTDDARSYFATCTRKFDVIVFGLLDSHTTTALTNARLDHYVYTRESIERAKSLLEPGGVVILSFAVQKPFIGDRMAGVLREVFGQGPLAFHMPTGPRGWGGTLFVSGDLGAVEGQLGRNQPLAAYIKHLQDQKPVPLAYNTRVATDDWPYIYLAASRIPTLYFCLTGLLVLLLGFGYWRWDAKGLIARWRRDHWHFFFLGAAFLLLEVQNISKASVALGNTWQVNAVIVSGVLTMILLANYLAKSWPHIRLPWVFAALIGTCLALYALDLAAFASLPYLGKALAIGTLTTLPMLFSGIIFIRSFTFVEGKSEALGANLIGALVGALLQSVTFIVGIKALLLMVAGLYLLALWTINRGLLGRPTDAAAPGGGGR